MIKETTLDSFNVIKKIMDGRQNRHTDFQLEHFVIGSEGRFSIYGYVRQLLKEIDVRIKSIEDFDFKIKKMNIDLNFLKQHNLDLPRFTYVDKYIVEKIEIKIEEIYLNISRMIEQKESVEKELNCLLSLADDIKPNIVDMTYNMDMLESEFWRNKFYTLMKENSNPSQLIGVFNSLPLDMQKDIQNKINLSNRQKNMLFEKYDND